MSSDRQLKALVTGAAREGGIGQAIVDRLRRDGMDVVTLDVEPGCTFQADVVRDELPTLEDIDVLVCNAALTTMFGAAHSMRLERWQRDLDVNLTGTYRVVQACLGGMRSRRFGRIVIISSTAAIHGLPAQVAYSTSKAGLLGMMRTLAAECAALGITANAVLPGMTASAGMLAMPEEVKEAWLERMPMGEFVHIEDIAEAVAFFASPAAARITGQALTVDGGHSLNTLSVTGTATKAAPGAPG
jgi:NAD(P)-dependent dehydrogenase (short-subunit alcohol dehydrogenase family)